MSRRLLWGIVVLLLVTNITTLIVWINQDEEVVSEKLSDKIGDKKSVATIGKEEISFEEWSEALQDEYGKKQLKSMVDREVVFQLAEKNGIEINEKLIKREISLLHTMQEMSGKEEIKEKEKAWRADILYRFYLEELLTQDISIDESKVRERYESYQGQYDFDETFQLSHIVVNDQETAEKVKAELDDGASFSMLAREYSIDQDSKQAGGYLGFYTSSTSFIPDDYFTIAEDMKRDTYSEPFNTGEGVAIVYLHHYLPSISFSYEEVKAQVRRELAINELEKNVSANALWKELDVEWIFE